MQLRGEEIYRLGGRNGLNVSALKLEEFDALHQLALKLLVTEFAGYNLAERDGTTGIDGQS